MNGAFVERHRLLATAAVFAALAALWPQLVLQPIEDTLLRPRFLAALVLLSYAIAPWLSAAGGALSRALAQRSRGVHRG